MSTTLAATALLMGLAGGPHCVAMCGAACAGVVRIGPRPTSLSPWVFQAGRLASYSVAGAVAASAVQSLAWATTQAAALRPVWTLFHLAVLAWGLTALFDRDRQFLHDRLAGTRLVQLPKPVKAGAPAEAA